MTDQTKNPYHTTKWGVYVAGYNDIYAAHSFKEAAEKCQQLNDIIVENLHLFNDEYYPLSWAKVERWEDIAGNSEHNPSETKWENALY